MDDLGNNHQPGKRMRQHLCFTCGSSFTKRSDLVRHERVHSGEKPFKCKFCAANFSQGSSLKTHLRTHSGERPFQCPYCKRPFGHSHRLKSHVLKFHITSSSTVCSICRIELRYITDLGKHALSHITNITMPKRDLEKDFLIDKTTCKSDSLGENYLTHTENTKEHNLSNEDQNTVTFPDDEIEVPGKHIQERFQSLRNCLQSKVSQSNFVCEICGLFHVDMADLQIHLMSHDEESNFTCGSCDLSFSSELNLREHEITHSNKRKFSCNICGISFPAYGKLKIHKRIHTGERPFLCKVCGQRFTHSRVLKIHTKIHQRDKGIFYCDICELSLSSIELLNQHLQFHVTGYEGKSDDRDSHPVYIIQEAAINKGLRITSKMSNPRKRKIVKNGLSFQHEGNISNFHSTLNTFTEVRGVIREVGYVSNENKQLVLENCCESHSSDTSSNRVDNISTYQTHEMPDSENMTTTSSMHNNITSVEGKTAPSANVHMHESPVNHPKCKTFSAPIYYFDEDSLNLKERSDHRSKVTYRSNMISYKEETAILHASIQDPSNPSQTFAKQSRVAMENIGNNDVSENGDLADNPMNMVQTSDQGTGQENGESYQNVQGLESQLKCSNCPLGLLDDSVISVLCEDECLGEVIERNLRSDTEENDSHKSDFTISGKEKSRYSNTASVNNSVSSLSQLAKVQLNLNSTALQPEQQNEIGSPHCSTSGTGEPKENMSSAYYSTHGHNHFQKSSLCHQSDSSTSNEDTANKFNDFEFNHHELNFSHGKDGNVQHLHSKSKADIFQCSQCRASFSHLHRLKRHKRIHMARHPQICQICHLSFVFRYALYYDFKPVENPNTSARKLLHISSISSSTEFPSKASKSECLFPGSSCSCRRRDENSFDEHYQHINTLHKQPKIYLCQFCGKAKSSIKLLNRHLTSHSNKTYDCDYCSTVFNKKSSLLKHIRIHNGERPFQCEICLRSFTQAANLQVHMRIHTGERPFSCTKCKANFAHSQALKIHLRFHSKEARFVCQTCGKGFVVKAALEKHASSHTGGKPYACKHCDSKLSSKPSLSRHMKKHKYGQGLLPFSCNFCLSKFAQSGHLRLHMKSHSVSSS